jgi:hypothetical protein
LESNIWNNNYQGANQVCDVSGNCTPSNVVKWRESLGALSPYTNSLDVLIGSNATASAKFAFLNMNSGYPIFNSTGYINAPGATLSASIASNVPLTVKGATSQTANLQEWQTSNGTVMAGINPLGHLGLGQSPSDNYMLINTFSTSTNTASQIGAYNNVSFGYYNPTMANGIYASYNSVTTSPNQANNITGAAIGDKGIVTHNGSGTISSAYGALFEIVNAGAGIITDATGFFINGNTNTGAGSIANNYGLYIGNENAGTSKNYSIYTNAGDVRFGDDVSIVGYATASASLALGNATATAGPGHLNMSGNLVAGGTVTGTVLNGTTSVNTGAGAGTARIDSTGNLTSIGTTQLNGVTYTWPAAGTAGYVLQSGNTGASSTLSWVDPVAAVASSIPWFQDAGVLYPKNSSTDVLIGGSATSSAKFAFKNVNSGTPTASISGTTANVATFIDGNGNISTTNRQNLVLGNSATYNTTGNILLNPNGTGNVGIGTTAPVSKLTVYDSTGANNTIRLGTSDTYYWTFKHDGTGQGQLYFINKNGAGENTRMTILNGGNVGIGTTAPIAKLDVNGDVNVSGYATMSGSLAVGNTTALTGPGNINASGRITGVEMYQGANQVCDVSGNCTGSTIVKWRENLGTLSPYTGTLDVLIGSNATASAKFAFLNVLTGTPTASISGTTTNVATYLTGEGNLAVTNGAHLTLGGTTTGMVDVSNDLNLASGKAYFINGTSVLNNNTLGTGVLTSSLTTVGALASGSIASGFGTIVTANTITGTTINGTTGINTGAVGGTQRIDSSGNLLNIGNLTGSGNVDMGGTASISGSLTFKTGASSIQTTAKNPLTIGGATTGNITLNPK